MKLDAIQNALGETGLSGWLFADHHGRDPIAQQVLGMRPDALASRRWYYFIPRTGEPRKLLHRIEPKSLAHLPGSEQFYSSWQEQQAGAKNLLVGSSKIAMQYSEQGMLLLVSLVDAGIVELVRSFGTEIVSSADMFQRLFAALSEPQIALHLEAGRKIDRIREEAFLFIRDRLGVVSECEARDFILRCFAEEGLFTDHGPVVATREHTGDPHYEPSAETDLKIRDGDFVLIDLWGKLKEADAPYYDITWTASFGSPKPEVQNIFDIVLAARDAAIEKVQRAIAAKKIIRGFEVDRAARDVIKAAGYAKEFMHRTGHSIGTTVHGMGANIDDLESRDERQLLAGSCFSIEPGIYLPEFGVRSEIDMIVESERAFVTGEMQKGLLIF